MLVTMAASDGIMNHGLADVGREAASVRGWDTDQVGKHPSDHSGIQTNMFVFVRDLNGAAVQLRDERFNGSWTPAAFSRSSQANHSFPA
jgi:hypothetical protein